MHSTKLHLLLLLYSENAFQKSVKHTTQFLAEKLGVSQQTCSRWLKELINEDFTERNAFGLKLTKNAVAYVENLLSPALNAKKADVGSFFTEGRVSSGLRDGSYYLSLPKYANAVKKVLGFKPFPGTLNVKISAEQGMKTRLRALASKKINGFNKNRQVLGSAIVFPAKIMDLRAGIIIPERSHYGEDVLEIIASVNLRKTLKLKNNSLVSVEIIVS